MRVVMTSDTHNLHNRVGTQSDTIGSVPEGDVLVHCGDATMGGRRREIDEFAGWFLGLPHKRKVFVPGNHDWYFQKTLPRRAQWVDDLPGVDILIDDAVTIDGLKFWGSPYQPEFMGWAFNVNAASRRHHFSKMPHDLDVLVTHCPPEGILDEVPDGMNVGCPELARAVMERTPKVHCFGHVHHSYGARTLGPTRFFNCAMANERYALANSPHVVDL